ncbi:hypothetical protein C6501_15640 [Candidatus Poribacteria bacterium]|nr:MAG: hypothetical protein C6501_15640 [Candidatus Poribacteria bacterium]
MESKTWGIIGGAVFVIGLLYFLMGSSVPVERHYQDAEAMFKRRDYHGAIKKYNKAIKASKKLGARTDHIDKDFPALANYKIVLCYDKLGETTEDIHYYTKAQTHIRKTLGETDVYKHRENLYYLWAQILYKTESVKEAEAKFTYFIKNFPNSTYVEEALFHIGRINYNTPNNTKAQIAFERLIDDFPTSNYRREAEYYIAQLLVAIHQLPDSFSKNVSDPHKRPQAPEKNPNIESLTPQPKSEKELEAENMYKIAISILQEDKDYEAYQLFSAIIKQFPESAYISFAYEGIGDIYNDSENYVKARENYDLAIHSTSDRNRIDKLYDKYHHTYLVPEYSERKTQPKLNSEHFIKAILLRKEGKFEEAAPLFETLSNSQIPAADIVYALYWGGYCYYQAAKDHVTLFSKSADLFGRLIRDYGDSPEIVKTYYYLALAYLEWGNAVGGGESRYQLVVQTVDEAISQFTNIENDSDQRWLNQMRDLKEKAVNNLPNHPIPVPDPTIPDSQEDMKVKHYDRGWAFLDEGLYDYAIDEFEECIDIDPKFKKAYCNLGVIYIKHKNYSKAINELKEAIKIDQQFKEAHFNIGLAYLRLGRFEDAKNAANVALQIDPNYEAAVVLRDSIAD